MDEDLRNRYRRDFRREPIRQARPSQPSSAPQPTPAQPQPQPVTSQPPVSPSPVAPPVQSAPPKVTPVPPQQINEQPSRIKKHKRRAFPWRYLVIPLIIAIFAAGGLFGYQKYVKKPTPAVKHYFPTTITKDQIQIPVYYPVNLPTGYKVGGFKVLQKNVLYYVIEDKGGDKFYVTIQPLATNFDFQAFKAKFAKPDEYGTPIGTNLVGAAGNTLLASIQTNQNVWIIMDSTAVTAITPMETITRAFQQVNL